MNTDGIWKLFCETGNVSCYLMYKELARRESPAEAINKGRETERPMRNSQTF